MTTPTSDETERLCNLLENRSIWTNPVNSGTLDNVVAHMRALQERLDYWQHKRTFLENAEIKELQAENKRSKLQTICEGMLELTTGYGVRDPVPNDPIERRNESATHARNVILELQAENERLIAEVNDAQSESGYWESKCESIGKERDKYKADAERIPLLVTRAYTDGYRHGHHDTVEGGYADVFACDHDTYFAEAMAEWLKEQDDE